MVRFKNIPVGSEASKWVQTTHIVLANPTVISELRNVRNMYFKTPDFIAAETGETPTNSE